MNAKAIRYVPFQNYAEAGQSIKLGRVEYYVSETCVDNQQKVAPPNPKSRKYFSNNILNYKRKTQEEKDQETEKGEKNSCKICLDDS